VRAGVAQAPLVLSHRLDQRERLVARNHAGVGFGERDDAVGRLRHEQEVLGGADGGCGVPGLGVSQHRAGQRSEKQEQDAEQADARSEDALDLSRGRASESRHDYPA
jgi:hypothetical protein